MDKNCYIWRKNVQDPLTLQKDSKNLDRVYIQSASCCITHPFLTIRTVKINLEK